MASNDSAVRPWSGGELASYLESLRVEFRIPIYPCVPGEESSAMSALVPPGLDSMFCEVRRVDTRLWMYPHALLVRDWGVVDEVENTAWWWEFWDVAEVEEAKSQRQRIGRWVCVNELEEHADVLMSGPQYSGRNYRRCDMAESFDQGGMLKRVYDL